MRGINKEYKHIQLGAQLVFILKLKWLQKNQSYQKLQLSHCLENLDLFVHIRSVWWYQGKCFCLTIADVDSLENFHVGSFCEQYHECRNDLSHRAAEGAGCTIINEITVVFYWPFFLYTDYLSNDRVNKRLILAFPPVFILRVFKLFFFRLYRAIRVQNLIRMFRFSIHSPCEFRSWISFQLFHANHNKFWVTCVMNK